MTDSVSVFPSGYRLTDSSTGAPLSGGVIYFYDAGTTTPKTVYSDKDLTTSLGTSVTTDGLGYPTSDGATKTLIYVGTATYKVAIKNSSGSTIAEHDNIKGAVATVDPGSLTVTSTRPVVTKGLNYTIVSGDQNTIFAGNCTGGSFTFTLPSAVTVGTGWAVTVQHAGTTNTITVATVSSQSINHGATNLGTSTTLLFNAEEITFVSDGSNWRCSPRIPRFVPAGTIMMHGATTAPVGWLECNGAAVSRTTYLDLFAAISTTFGTGNGTTTFNVPDMRGYFARGWDNSRGIDSGRTFGSTQTDDFKSHNHSLSFTASGQNDPAGGNNPLATGTSVFSGPFTPTYLTMGTTGGTETRPKNISLLYIIKH